MNAGHDHTAFRDEVEQRWGKKAFTDGDAWWREMSDAQREEWKADQSQLTSDWRSAASSGADPAGEVGQALAARHVAWLSGIPGTPGFGQGGATDEYIVGLADMYVADARLAAHYGGAFPSTYVRNALREYVASR